MKKILFALLMLALVAGCSTSDQLAAPKISAVKTCASARIAIRGLRSWNPMLVDTTVAPPDTVATFDAGYIREAARSCDALYFAVATGGTTGGLEVFDLSKPSSPKLLRTINTTMQFQGLSISGATLSAGYELCDDNGDFVKCYSGKATWDISDPLNPLLTSVTPDP